jgi:predicted RecA/RadA family phage recombinase
MATNYEQNGKVITITAGANITSGQVVKVGQLLGVAIADIANGAQGPVQIEGVFRCPKVSGAVIAQGESLVWDVSANSGAGAFDDNAATPATGDVSGATAVAAEAAGNGVTTLAVKFTGVPGAVA